MILHFLTAHPQTKAQLAAASGLSQREVEAQIQEARLNGVPIVSDSDGYRYAQTSEEVLACVAALRRRASNQFLTARALRRAARRMEVRERAPLSFDWSGQ